MTDIFQMQWKSLPEQTYIDEARGTTKVIWLGRLSAIETGADRIPVQVVTENDLLSLFKIIGLRTRQCSIDSYDQWEKFEESCHLVRYKNGKFWQDEDAENYALTEFAVEKENDPEFIRNGEFNRHIIITGYDTQRDKRLIIDGIDRSTILTNERRKRHRVPTATIYECYGSTVDRIFPCDFSHF